MSKNKTTSTNAHDHDPKTTTANETATDYSKIEAEANETPARNYEEPLHATTHTADTSVNALKEISEQPEETKEEEKKKSETADEKE